MKIRTVTEEDRAKVSGLLRAAFPGSGRQEKLVSRLSGGDHIVHEWVLIHINRAVAYIAFTNAYVGKEVVGLHLAPLAVKPEFQRQGFGSELLKFALRQPQIREQSIYVLGAPAFFSKYGFDPCLFPVCPFDKDNTNFLSMRNTMTKRVTVGYESAFHK
ncbi:N-acetyltransferase [Myxococcota bacterium]|nr:N-acetyltransferase [Myxococcota bacterium]MBU1535455.1 N-acetyltransferase [Myxococcota bacterium]